MAKSQELAQYFKQLQRTCEFQSISLSDKIKQDILIIALKDKYSKFQKLGKKVRKQKLEKPIESLTSKISSLHLSN